MRRHLRPFGLALAILGAVAAPHAAFAGKGTALLFPFISNQSGFDTGITISNTTADPFGEKSSAGQCTFSYFSQNGNNPDSQTSTEIAPGHSAVLLLSAGGSHGIQARPGFQGYMIVDCTFSNARGFGFFSDLGARNLAANVPVEIIKRQDRK